MSTDPKVGARLRALREARGRSLRSLARETGLGRNALSRIETGRQPARFEEVTRLLHALGVSVAEFEDPDATREAS
jgi:transcriptional regulator with XRE-family HTH domain